MIDVMGYMPQRLVHKAVDIDVSNDPTQVDRENRTITSVITCEEVDRDGEVILTRGLNLKPMTKNPVVLFMHDMFTIVGKAMWFKREDDRIIAKTRFAETDFANDVFEWYANGFARGWSIGMDSMTIVRRRPTEKEIKKNPKWAQADWVIEKADVFEYSAVSVPACPSALSKMVHSKTAGRYVERWIDSQPVEVVKARHGVEPIAVPVVVLPRPVARCVPEMRVG